MLFKIYVFGLVLGGVLLAASMFGGDHDSDGGDIDVDADGDADGGLDHGIDDGPAHGDVAGLAALFLSLRFWSFFAAFFGLTGVVFEALELAGSMATLGLSLGMGMTCGLGAAYTIRALTRSEVGAVPGAADYIGQTGRVLLPVGGEGPGKVRLELKGTTVDVLAVTDDDQPLAVGDTALVVEMQDTTASVTRMSNGEKGN
ncbi:MAG: NfeD family protein [Myxococcales bacterium]|nr:NfeD family protein [Myxococcales bacterium]